MVQHLLLFYQPFPIPNSKTPAVKSKIILLAFVFQCISFLLIAGDKQPVFFLNDSLLHQATPFRNSYLEIVHNWRYKSDSSGAQAADFASPDFDDSLWEPVNSTLPIDSLPASGWRGSGWFRLRLVIDSQLLNKALVINLIHYGASDLYVDGKLLYSFGHVGTSVADEQGYSSFTQAPGSVVFNQCEHVIAVHYSGFCILHHRPPIKRELGFSLAIGDPDLVNRQLISNARFFKPLEALVIAVPFIFALIHFILFLFYRREKSNLYFSLFACAIALWGILEHESFASRDAELSLLLQRLMIPYLALMPVTGILFLYSLFHKKIPFQFYNFLVVAIVVAIISWYSLFAWLSLVLFLLSTGEMLRIVVVSIRQGMQGAWIIGNGFGAFCVSLLILLAIIPTGNFSLQLWYLLTYLTGVLPVLLSMSVYLSMRIAGTHRTLESQMKKTMELEIENARKEAELKKAVELQEAYHALENAHRTLKETQAQLIHSEKMASLGELTAGIAHEIQNPLNFVNNFSEVNKELIGEMRQEIEQEHYEEVKAISKDIEENEEKINLHGKRAAAIVKGMLQHSRGSSGVKELTDINALCDEFLRLSYHGLRAKDKSFNATMKTEFDDSIGSININPQDIGRVILNLLTNAFYAVNEKKKSGIENYEPTVTVSTRKKGDKTVISVTDNGNGIPQKIADKIFQPFFTTKPSGQGTGLGLSLSFDIITKGHGGELIVETKENEFTRFTITL